MKTIALFFGGKSPEHDISIITGVQTFHAFNRSKYTVIPIYVSREGLFYTGKDITNLKKYNNLDVLISESQNIFFKKTGSKTFAYLKRIFGYKKIEIDCAFLAFHGGNGENGEFQGFCETLDVPYTGTGVLGSSISMDKISAKNILINSNIPVSEYRIITEKEFIDEKEKSIKRIEELSYPLFIKPSNGGSSIGVSRAKNKNELINSLEIAFAFDSNVLIESEFIHDTEINISCLGNHDDEILVSECEEVYSDNDFLDFENKYLKGDKSKKNVTITGSKGMSSTNRKIPADISEELKKQIISCAKKAFINLKCGGVARIDFLVNKKENKMVLVEVNTIPGSLSFYLWEKTNLSFDKLIDKLIELAFEKQERKSKKLRYFKSNIFKNI